VRHWFATALAADLIAAGSTHKQIDSDAIPPVDDIDHQGELNLLLLGDCGLSAS